MRAFFCLTTDKVLNRDLAAVVQQLRARIHTRVAWVPAHNFHVTVRFLGEIEPMLTVDLERMLRSITVDISPFNLVIDRLGAFPNVERARVIWAGGEAPPEFRGLVDRMNHGLATLGFPPDRKESIAHITLGRVKGRPDHTLSQVLAAFPNIAAHTLHVERVTLMESILTARGAEYNPLFSVPLKGETNAV